MCKFDLDLVDRRVWCDERQGRVNALQAAKESCTREYVVGEEGWGSVFFVGASELVGWILYIYLTFGAD